MMSHVLIKCDKSKGISDFFFVSDVAKTILENSTAGVDVADASGKTPLIHASLTGNLQLVDLLLTYGASIDVQVTN